MTADDDSGICNVSHGATDAGVDAEEKADKGSSVMGVEFAPLSIPLDRRLQTLAVCLYMSMAMFMGLCCSALLAYLILYTQFKWVAVLYLTWMVYDWNVGEEGGREWT